jgi:FtsP/CotA-like multicopper oxidase with cupredoxin domain
MHRGSTRRDFLRATGVGAGGVVVGGALFAAARGEALPSTPATLGLVATDGHMILPNRPDDAPLYIFGFTPVPVGASVSSLSADFKGKARTPAPILDFRQDTDIRLTLTNVGLQVRPDLADSHTVHWHGFRTPPALTDGVPEVSVAVPINRQFTYFYRPHDPGTYMYHCHFEDVEHVQMGMTGIVFVRPTMGDKFAYNAAATAFDREFAILLNEIWTLPHDHGEQIQESIWTDYEPDYWTLNGRVYPQTLLPNDSTSLPPELRILTEDGWPCQPISSLVQCNGGERVLLRLANLGYQQHAMTTPGLVLDVVGKDATLLANGSVKTSMQTETVSIGPGESFDCLFTAPAAPGTYVLYDRAYATSQNRDQQGIGGMRTEIHVLPAGTLPAQTAPNA